MGAENGLKMGLDNERVVLYSIVNLCRLCAFADDSSTTRVEVQQWLTNLAWNDCRK